MILTDFQKEAVEDWFEGWELVEFLDIPIAAILQAAIDNDWINEDNVDDLLEEMRVR